MNLTKINLKQMIINPEIAEICGIHAGDGYLRYSGKYREFDVSGGVEEKGYYDEHVIPLFNKTFNLSLKGKFYPSRNTYGFATSNPLVINALKNLGFPSGKKTLIVNIPKPILNGTGELWTPFLRGYFDTDGCLTFDRKIYNSSIFKKTRNYYPRLMFTTCSKNLAQSFKYLSELLGFKTCTYLYYPKIPTENVRYKIQITGLKALNKWMKLIGTKNPSKFSRYLIWKKFGFCPPNTTYQQRIDILNGKLDPESLY